MDAIVDVICRVCWTDVNVIMVNIAATNTTKNKANFAFIFLMGFFISTPP
jgi:hypothetical protein